MRRISRAQLVALADTLSPRDEQVLVLFRRLRVATAAQIAVLCYPDGTEASSARMARRTLRKLADLRVLAELPYRPGGVRAGSKAAVFALDVAGLRLTDPAERPYRSVRRPWTTTPAFLAHHLAVTQLYVDLVERERQKACEVISFVTEPACWRPFVGREGRQQVLRPDAYLVLGLGDYEHHWFLELDRDTEGPAAVSRKLIAVRDHYQRQWDSTAEGAPVEPRTLFLVPTDGRRQQIAGLAQQTYGPGLPELVQVIVRDRFPAAVLADP